MDINEGSPTAGVAIGYKSNVTGTKPSVAIGRFAKAGAGEGEGFYYGGTNKPTEDKASAIIAPTEGEFAIGDVSGSNTYTRRITGLAAGKDLTDAVNVSQLKALGDTGLKFGANLPNNTAKTPNPITAKIGKQIDIKGAEIDINKDNIITNISKDNQDNLTISIATKPDLIANSIGRTLDTGANAEGNRLRFLADDKFTLGKGVEATAANSFAIGFGSKALQQNAIALGNGAEAGLKSGSDDNQIAIGTTSKATGHSAISIGNMWQNDSNKAIDGATGEYSVAIGGEHTRASGAGALAFGRSAQATGAQSIAIGSKINKDDTTQSTASNVNAIAIGSGSDASGENSIALGSKEDIQESTGSRNRAQKTSAKGANSLALGRAAVAEGENSIAIGRKAKTEGAIGTSKAPANQIAIGTSAYTNGEEAISIGTVSQGSDTGARAKRAISLGNGDIKANGERAVAIGSDTQALGQGAVAIGGGEHDKAGAKIKNIIANAENTIAIGTAAQAMSGNAIAIGTRSSVNISNGPTAGVAIGLDTIVEGDKPSVAIGRYSKASVTGEAEQGYYLDGKVPVATTSASEGEVKKTNAIHTPTAGVFAIGDIDRNNEPVTRRITGLAAGKADTDAVNVSQLKGMENAGLKLAADIPGVKSNQALTAKLGRQVNIVSGDLDGANSTFKGVNLKTNISQDNQGNVTTITVALDKDLTSDSIGRSKDGNGIVNQGNRLRFVDDNKFTLGKGVEVSSVANDKVIAIGFTEGNTAVAAKGNKSVAIGFGVQSTGLNSIAIGSGKTIATGSGSIAIGNNAIVKQDNSVALGSDSETAGVSGAGKYFGLDSSKAESGIVMEPNHGEIAIGSSTKTRRLTGLSAGKNKTDAVNVYQLESLANNTIKISADNTAISDGNTENAISKKLSEGLNIVIKGAKNSGLSTKIKGDAIEIELAKAETIKDPLPKDSGKPEEGPSDEKFTTEKAVAEYVKSKTDNLNPNIAIRANGKNANKQENEKNDISLKDGLNFIDGDNTVATITDTSDVKFDLKPALTGITSISGNTKGKAILTFKEDGNISTSGKLELNASGSIVDGDNNAVTGATVKSALTEVGNTDNSIKVDANTNANGKTTYTVSLKESYKNKLDSLAENPNATYITNENYKIGTGINEKEWEKKLEIAYKADGDKKADGGAIADKKTKLSDGFIFKGDNNIAITTDLGKDETGKGIIKYSLSNKLTGIQEISNGNGENGNTSIKIKDDKIEFGNRSIDNFKSGSIAEDSKEAVSGEAVYNHLKTNYASSGDLKTTLNSYLTRVDAGNTYVGKDSTISLTGNDGGKTAITIGSNSGFKIVGGEDVDFKSGKNIITSVNDNEKKLTISLSKNPKFDSMNVAGVTISPKDDILNKIKDLPKDQKDEKLKELGITEAELNSSEIGVIHANGFKIAHIADGEVTKGSKAVVNGGQLYEVDEKAKSALNKATVNETSIQDNVGKITKNTQAITQNTTNIGKNTEKLNEHAQSIQGINNTLSEHTSSISSNTTKIEKGIVLDAGTRAEDVSGSRKVNLGEIIKIVGKNNINTVLEKDGSLSVVLNDSIELKKGNQSNDKLTINKSNSGKISGLSAGTEDLDATNLGQIKPLAKALNMNYENDGSIKEPKYKIGNGENNTFNTIQDALTAINTTAEKGANGKITFATGSKNKEVGLSETVYFEVDNTTNTKLLSIDLEDTGNRFKFKIDKNPTFGGKVTANGFDAQSNVISNVATGKNPNDAVNLQQLNDLKASFNLETGNTVSLTLNAPVSYKAEVNKKDGSNGKEETIVFKAKKEGEKVEKFYRKIDVDKNGKVLNEAVPLSDEELKTIKVAALDENQGLSNPLRFTNIADGDLNKGSKDAITGNQLKPLIDALGMTISGNTINNPNWTIGNNEYHSVAEVILGTVKGKIGTVIITDKDGNPALRATSHDGKTKAFYKAEDIDDAKSKELDKIVVKENAVAINEKDIQMSILDPISGLAKTGENGKNTRKLSNLASGTTDYDAVNVKQLKDLEIDLTLKGNKVKPVVTYDDKTKATITLGSENNPTTIKNLKDGTLSDKSTEAVTGAQLYKTNQEISSINSNISNINQGWKLSINDDKSGNKINYGDLVTFKTDGNLSFTNGDEEASEKNQHILKLSLNKIINVDDIKIATEEVGKNKTSLITGLTNTTWDENNVVKNRAATEGQIESAIDTINTNAKKAGNFTVKYAQKLNTVKPDYGRVMLVGEEDDANGNIGTVISNLKGGEVNANSKEAINGSQLYEYSSAIAKVIGGNENSYDPIKGKISDFSVKINDNNGNPSVMNNVKEALESLNAGWRILGGKIPNENGKLDAVAGATNVERGQSLGIFSSGNISTRVIKKEISLTPELDGSRLIIENNEIYTNADKTKKLDKEKFKTIKLADDKETLTWDQVEVQGNKVIKKDGNSEIKISSVVAPLEKRKTAYVDIAMTPTPDFDGVTVNKYGIKIKGYNEAKDKETGNNIVLNADGEGTITGLSNVDFKDGTGGKISLKTMTEDSLDNLGLMTNRAASEGQLKEIIADYIERTNKTITFNGDEKSVSKKLGESIEIKGGVKDESKLTSGNIGVIADDTNKLDIKLAKDLTGISSFSNLGSDGKNTTITISDSGKVIFARDTDVENKKDGVILSGIKDDESDLTSAVSRKSLSDKMTAISNKGLSFTANGISDLEKDKGTQEIHKNLGDKLGVIGGHKYTTEFTSTNLATKIEDGNIVIGMTETPKFKELTISKDGKDSVVTVNDKGELILKNGADGKDGKDKKWSEVVTRELLEKEGLIGKVNVDGKDGVKGPSGRDGSRGPAGKDGTNGANINEKVNVLRNGEAGSLVYVNADGERVVRDENKFYPGDAVRASDGKWYPKGTTFTEDGKTPKENSDGTTPSEIKGIDAKDVQLAVVNPDGETKNNPTIIGNVASTIAPDLDKLNKAVSDAGTENKKEKEAELVKAAKDAVTGNTSSPNGLLQKSGKDLAKAATIGDLQTLAIAGLDFGANGITTGEGKEVHKKLGEKLAILGGENYDSSSFSSENVATMIDAKGDILIGMKKNPKFDTIVIQTPNKDTSKNPEITLKTLTTPNEDKTGVKPTLNFASGTGKVVLNGVADGTTEDSVVTKAALDKLVSKVGLDGTNGDRGPSGRDGSSGAIGADGLDGKNAPNLSEKINALRAGEAGAVVYVNEAGERVVRDGDNFYLADSVRGKDGQWYKKGTTLNKEGEPNNPGAPLAEKISVDKVQLAVVNPTGKTIEPTILRNIAGNIALEEVEKAKNELAKLEKAAGDDPSLAQDVSDAKLKLETAKKNISKEAADKIKELAVKNSEDLNRAATVGDLQTLAIAGLNFEANGVDSNTGKEVHKKLGEKLGVLGGTGNFFNNEYNSSNVATRVTTSGDIEIGFKKVPDFAGLVIAKDGVPGRDGKDAVITVDKDGKLIVKNGTDGVNGVNGIDGTSGKGTEIITREVLEKEGLVGKNGKDGANGVDGTNGRNGKDTSGNIVGPSGRDGLNGTNGKDAPTIGEKINALRNGEAGTLVYTTTDGERVVRDGDNFYKASELEGKVKGPNGKWYPAGTEFESNGTPKNGAVEETPKILNTSLPENKLQLAAVNADGSTSVATPVGNVASAIIDNTEVATAEKAVTTAEKTVVDTETKLRNEKIAIVNAKDEIAKIEADIAKKNTRIAELGSDPTDEVEKAKLQGEITALQANKTAAEREIATAEGKVTDLKANLETNKATLKTKLGELKVAKGPITEETAKEIVLGKDSGSERTGGLLKASGDTLNKVATVGDIQAVAQAGLDFGANGNIKTGTIDHTENNKIHRTVGQTLGILGDANNRFDSTFSSANLVTKVDGENIILGMKKTPEFAGIVINGKDGNNGKDAILTVNDKGRLIVKNSIDGKDGLDGNTGTYSEVVTREIFDKLAGKTGLDGKDGSDGANGRDGKVGDTIVGPAGQDGLNGRDGKDAEATTIIEKVNALRNGEAGSIVYTTADGERVVRDGDNFYKASEVLGKVKGKDASGNTVWYKEGTKLNKDGRPVDIDGEPLEKEELTAVIAKTPELLSDDEKEKIQLAAVDKDGSTKAPTTIGNVKSNIALDDKEIASAKETLAKAEKELKELPAGTDTKEATEKVATAKKALTDSIDAKAPKATAKVEELVITTGTDLNKAATVGDIQTLAVAGMNFEANGTADENSNETHKILGAKIGILGGTTYDINSFDFSNLSTVVENGDIKVAFKKAPKFNGLIIGKDGLNGKDAVITVDKEGKLIVKNGVDGSNGIDGVNGLDGKDGNGTQIITKDYLEKEGLIGKAGKDGVKGADGRDGKVGDTIVGPAGKDGLNGRDGLTPPTLNEKINALRNGEAGSVVYTDKDGNRVVRDGNDFYNADKIKNYIKVDDTWYTKDSIDPATGKLKTDGTAKEVTPGELAKAKVDKDNLQLVAVSPDGETTTPTTIGNVKSSIALNKVAKSELEKVVKGEVEGTDNTNAKALTKKAAAKVEKLVTTTGNDLNKAATVGDIQTLAVAGMNFEANGTEAEKNNSVHKILGAKLGVLGKAGNYFDDTYDSVNVATKVTDKGDIEIGIKKSPEFNEIVVHGKDGKDGKSAIITVDKDGNLAIKNGLNGVDGKDGIDGVNGENAKTTEIITKDYLEKEGLIAKDGVNGTSGSNGRDGAAGPAGRDGLSDTSLPDKVNALRNGEAGAIIYTDNKGNRVVRDGDTFYNADKIKDYVKVDNKFYKKDDVENGKPKSSAKAIEDATIKAAKVNKQDLELAAVSPDGGTKTATSIGNVASAIIEKANSVKTAEANVDTANKALTDTAAAVAAAAADIEVKKAELAKAEKAAGAGASTDAKVVAAKAALKDAKQALTDKIADLGSKQTALKDAETALENAISGLAAINATDAKNVVLGKEVAKGDGTKVREGGLLNASGATLNKVATVGDLQAVAQAELDFETNDGAGKAIHKTLGSTLKIEGKSRATYDETNYSSDNLVTRNDNGVVRVAMLKTPEFNGLTFKDNNSNKNITIVNNAGVLDMGGAVITNVQDGTSDNSVVTRKAFKEAVGGLTNKIFKLRIGNSEEEIEVKLGDTVNLLAGKDLVVAGKGEHGTAVATTGETVAPEMVVKPGDNTTQVIPESLRNSIATNTVENVVANTENTTSNSGTANTTNATTAKPETHVLAVSSNPDITPNTVTISKDDGNKKPVVRLDNKSIKFGDLTEKGEVNRDSNGNLRNNGTTTVIDENGITVTTTKNGIVDKETSNIVIKDGTITGLKNTEVDEKTGEFKEDQVVNGGTLNRVIEDVRKQNTAFGEGLRQVNQRVDRVENKMKKGLANAAAMAGMSFQDIGKNQAAVAAAVGGYEGTQAVAVGVQMAPTENVRVNAKMSLTPGKNPSSIYSVGASWKFDMK